MRLRLWKSLWQAVWWIQRNVWCPLNLHAVPDETVPAGTHKRLSAGAWEVRCFGCGEWMPW